MATTVSPDPKDAADTSSEVVHLRVVRELVSLVVRTVKTLRLYDAKNATHQSALAAVGEAICDHVRDHGPLTLQVERGAFLMEGESVYADQEEAQDGLAFRLYADGVRTLSFRDQVTDVEARTAVSVLAQGTGLTATDDDDIVTLFWNQELTHVTLVAVEPESGDGPLGEERREPPEVVEKKLSAARMEAAQAPMTKSVHLGPDVLSVFDLNEAECGYLEQLVSRELAVDPQEDLVEILCSVVSIEPDGDGMAELLDTCETLLRDFLRAGRMTLAHRLTSAVVALTEPAHSADTSTPRAPDTVEEAHRFLMQLGRGPLLDALAVGVDRLFPAEVDADGEAEAAADTDPQHELNSLTHYLSLFRAGDGLSLLRLAVPRPRLVQDALCDAVARICADDRHAPMELLREGDSVAIRCALRVLTTIGRPEDLAELSQLSDHKDADVRRMGLDAVARISNGAHPALLPYLADPDPRVRRHAVSVVQRANYGDAVEILQELVETPAFMGWDVNERRSVFEAIGSVGRNDVVPFLGRYLRRGGILRWFGGHRNEEMAMGAVAGLRAVGTAEARKWIERGAKHRRHRVRATCVAVLREMDS